MEETPPRDKVLEAREGKEKLQNDTDPTGMQEKQGMRIR